MSPRPSWSQKTIRELIEANPASCEHYESMAGEMGRTLDEIEVWTWQTFVDALTMARRKKAR